MTTQTSARATTSHAGPRAARRTQPLRDRRSVLATGLMSVVLLYAIVPLFWLVVNSSKTRDALFGSFGLWFSGDFALWDNIVQTFTYNGGEFGRWVLNTLLYVAAGAFGATALAAVAGYGLARFRFPGRRGVVAVVLGAVAIPATALAVPTFLMFSAWGLTNTPWSVILPSLMTPFGLYLVWFFADDAVPAELLEAARIDGAREMRIFRSIALRLLMPGLVPVLLFNFVNTWNNYFLPLIMLSESDWFPLTVGLNNWSLLNTQAATGIGEPIDNIIITGSLITIIPTVLLFLFLQRFWQTGLTAGSVKQ